MQLSLIACDMQSCGNCVLTSVQSLLISSCSQEDIDFNVTPSTMAVSVQHPEPLFVHRPLQACVGNDILVRSMLKPLTTLTVLAPHSQGRIRNAGPLSGPPACSC